MERITDKYVFFYGSIFSNWYDCRFKYKEHIFHNSEQAFMWEKALFFGDEMIAEMILETPHPAANKELGRKVRGFNAAKWAEESFSIMVGVNYAKFDQNKELAAILLSTEDKIIVEASPTDRIWGIGWHWSDDRCLNPKNWRGTNWLGEALMEVRDILKPIDHEHK